MPVPDFSPGEVLTAAAMDSIGLWLVKTQTIGSAVSSVTVTDAFSADYQNYLVLLSGGVGTTNARLGCQLRNSGGTSTTGYYAGKVTVNLVNSAVVGGVDNNASSWTEVGRVGTDQQMIQMSIFSPFLAKTTTMSSQIATLNTGGVMTPAQTAIHTVSTSYTDFVLTATAGTLTGGDIRVYGYRN
jgi:hypothetical protein